MGESTEIELRFSALAGQTVRKYWHLALPLLFFMAMFLFFPYRERFEFSSDEGIETMKSLMLVRGHALYSEIWNDHPPLFTYLLAACIRFFGTDINAARTLVLLFSTVLIAVAAHYLRTTWGGWHALAGVLLIFLLPFYTSLSVSVMLAVPNLTPAMLSLLAMFAWHKRHQDRWLVLSALALGLSVLTKLFTAFLAPIFVLGILLDEKARQVNAVMWPGLLRPALLWGFTFLVITFGLGLILVGPANIGQLLAIHLRAPANQAFLDRIHSISIAYYLGESWPILLLAELGCIFVVAKRRWTSLYLLAWAVIAFIMLSFYAPIWYHHQILITVPAALLAGVAVGEALRLLPRIIRSRPFSHQQAFLIFSILGILIFILTWRLPQTLPDFDRPPVFITKAAHSPWREQVFLTKMTDHAPKTHWVVTTLPLYAFRVGLQVPPFLAVPSQKRIANGELTERQIIEIVDQYQPEQVLLKKSEFPELEKHLEGGYRLLLTYHRKQLYLREDLKIVLRQMMYSRSWIGIEKQHINNRVSGD